MNIFKNYKKRQEKFNDLSSREKLEYYYRFNKEYSITNYWYVYVILTTTQLMLMLSFIFLRNLDNIGEELKLELANQLLTTSYLSGVMQMLLFFSIVISLINLIVGKYQKSKWLRAKNIK